MTRDAALTSINCTSCGAGLDVLGGGRVTTHICPYCGSELDAQDDYAVLRQYSDLPRPDSPFRIGMQGQIHGVDWTIIGTLGLREDYDGKTWTWVEHQIYSPTHGYAWLVVEDGHTAFSRRQRRMPRPAHMGVNWVETSENPPTVRLNGETFKYFQTSTSKVTFAEGEFTWSPKIGQENTAVSAMSGSAMLDFSQGGTEREIYQSTYLPPAKTCAAFGLEPGALTPRGVHPLQPYERGPNAAFIKWTALCGAFLALFMAMVFSVASGSTVLAEKEFRVRSLPSTVEFGITQTDKLAGIRLSADVSNSWAYLEVELTDPEGTPLFEAGRTVEYYFGRDADGSWSEGNRSSALYFRPTVPGTYELTIDTPEAGTWGGGREARRIKVSAAQGYTSGFWPMVVAVLLSLTSGWHWARRGWHHSRRWAKSDWSDD